MFAYSRQEIMLAGVFLLLGIGLVFFGTGNNSGDEVFYQKKHLPDKTFSRTEGEAKIVVHISGAVVSPGVYVFSESKRIVDALERAGGSSWNADLDQINLAAPLVDGMQVFIPMKTNKREIKLENNGENLININRASQKELESLPNIGPSRARAIIEYREKKGGFQRADDLLDISGIGEKTLEKLRKHVRFY